MSQRREIPSHQLVQRVVAFVDVLEHDTGWFLLLTVCWVVGGCRVDRTVCLHHRDGWFDREHEPVRHRRIGRPLR
jgi:hypothetical protein